MNKFRHLKINGANHAIILGLFLFLCCTPPFIGTLNAAPVSATATPNDPLVSLNLKNRSIRQILNEIEKQTHVGFVLNDAMIEKNLNNLSIQATRMPLSQVMDRLLAGTNYQWRMIEGSITIIKKSVTKEALPAKKTFPVRGRVVDATEKKSVIGASVIVKGTTRGIITDINGEFEIDASTGDELQVSYIGMITEIVPVSEKKMRIELKTDVMDLDDVVVTGFSNIRQTSYTGNAVSVKREDLLKVSKTSVMKALQTFDPSFRLTDNNLWGSDPNALPEMNIRGASSVGRQQALFNADGTVTRNDLSKSNLQDNPNLPTFIMDGFEISATKLYDFDPNRIESVTILKDAAATALYGSRAANGVIVITTVKPKPGRLNIAYNFTGSVQYPDLSDYNLTNAAEKLETERLAGYFTWDPVRNEYDDAYNLQKEYYNKLENVLRGVDTYWLSKPLRTVFNHKHSLYIDGGTENLRFGIDLQYNNQDGVMKGSARNNYSAGFYLQYDYKKLSIRNYTSYQQTRSTESPYGDFSDYTTRLPYDTYQDETGALVERLRNWGTGTGLYNPLYEASLYNFERTNRSELVNNLTLNWDIMPGLLLKGQLSLTKTDNKTKEFYDPKSLNTRNINQPDNKKLSSGTLYLNNQDDFALDFSATLSYNKTIKQHNINALAGVSITEDRSDNNNATYLGFPSGVLSSPEYATEMYRKTQFGESTRRLAGFLFSANYSYRDIYLADASVRVDGSSSFGSSKRFAPFWSLGAGINLHNYEFMNSVRWINMFKIRGSYGQTGKANFSAYQARTTFEVMTQEWYKTGYGAQMKALGNSRLTWETTNTFDVGAELQLFNNIFYIKGTYYDKRTVDLVNSVTVPTSTGFTNYYDNVGEISNRGYEFNVRVMALNRQDLSLIINANLAHNTNRLEKISESQKQYNKRVQEAFNYNNQSTLAQLGLDRVTPFLQYEEGGSMTAIYGVRSLGINPSDGNDIYVSRLGGLTNVWSASDQVILGNTEPTAQGSFGFSLTYKRFNLYSSFMYEWGGQRFNQTLMDKVENVNLYTTNVDKRVLTDRWRQPGDHAKYKALQYDKLNTYLTKPNSRFVQDYNMLQLSSVELSYDFSPAVTDYLGVSMLRLTAGMNDLFHLSSIKQERGLNYPYARSFNFSVKLSF